MAGRLLNNMEAAVLYNREGSSAEATLTVVLRTRLTVYRAMVISTSWFTFMLGFLISNVPLAASKVNPSGAPLLAAVTDLGSLGKPRTVMRSIHSRVVKVLDWPAASWDLWW